MTTESSFKFGIKIGERTYFKRVGEDACGFRIVRHERIKNPQPNPKRPMLDAIVMEKSGQIFTITNGIPYVFTESGGSAQQNN